jgi:two-component SAPR family response regulator
MLNILLIDDDIVEFRLIERMLKECYGGKFILRYANTVEKAVTILKTQKTDIVLLDDKLDHGRTALDSVPVLKGVNDSVPLVLISSDINAEYLRSKTILNVYDIIDKFNLRERIQDGLLKA